MVLPENLRPFDRDFKIISEGKKASREGSGNLKCNICHEEYDGNHVPRLLSCGHSCCTPCLDNILSRNKKCPKCKFKLKPSSATDFPVVYQLMKEASSTKTQSEISTLDVGKCEAHDSLMFFRCMSCDVWLCRDCVVVDHPQGTQANPKCKVLSVPDAVEEIKITTPKKIDQEIHSIKYTKDQMSTVLQNNMGIKQGYQAKIRSLREELSKQENELQEILNKSQKAENCIEELNELERSLQEKKTIICNSLNPSDIRSALDDNKTRHEYISSVIANSKKMFEARSSLTPRSPPAYAPEYIAAARPPPPPVYEIPRNAEYMPPPPANTRPRPAYAPEYIAAARPPPPPVYEIPRNAEYMSPPPATPISKKDPSTKSKKEKTKGSKAKDPFPARKVPLMKRLPGNLFRK